MVSEKNWLNFGIDPDPDYGSMQITIKRVSQCYQSRYTL